MFRKLKKIIKHKRLEKPQERKTRKKNIASVIDYETLFGTF